MKILQLTHNYPSETDSTEGIFLHRINQSLVDKIDITVVLLKPKFRIPSISRCYTIGGIDVIEVNYFRPRGRILNSLDGVFMLSATPILLKLDNNFDVIHSHWQTDAGIIGIYLSKKYNKPLIVSVRGARIFNRSIYSVYGKISSFVFKNANKIHTHGENILTHLSRKYHIQKEKMTLIPNIIFNKKQLDSLLQRSSHKRTRKDHYKFLFVGLDGKNKGLLDAIQSFLGTENRKHQLTIVTDTSNFFFNSKVKPIISNEQNIKAVNKVSPECVHKLFSESDVFLFPSYAEGSPNVVIEAMAAGCYILSYNIPGLDKLLIHNQNGRLVKKKDVRSLTKEVDLFISGKMNSEYKKYKEYNHNFIVENYDCDKIISDYIKMYKGCI